MQFAVTSESAEQRISNTVQPYCSAIWSMIDEKNNGVLKMSLDSKTI